MNSAIGGTKDQPNPIQNSVVNENLAKSRLDQVQNSMNNPNNLQGSNNIKDLYVKSVNDVKEIRSIKHLERVNLNLDSPLFSQSCKNLGIMRQQCQKRSRDSFWQKGIHDDVIDLRHKHYQARLLDTLNLVLHQRRKIKIEQLKKQLRENQDDNNQHHHYQTDLNLRYQHNDFRSHSTSPGISTDRIKSRMFTVENQAKNLKQKAMRDAQKLLQFDYTVRQKERETLRKLQNAQRRTWAHLPRAKLGNKAQNMTSNYGLTQDSPQRNQDNQSPNKDDTIARVQREREYRSSQERQRLMANLKKTQERLKKRKMDQANQARQREIAAQQKRNHLAQFRANLDSIQERKCLNTLEEIKLKRRSYQHFVTKLDEISKQKHSQLMQQKSVDIRTKNKMLENRVKEFNYHKTIQQKSKIAELQQKQQNINKKLKHFYQNLNAEWKEMKQIKREKLQKGAFKKKMEDKAIQKKQAELLKRLKNAQNVVEQFKVNLPQYQISDKQSQKQHEIMLRKEYRRLKQQDMVQTHDRLKRLECQKKLKIMQSQKQHDDKIKQSKQEEKLLSKCRSQLMMRAQKQKQMLFKTIQDIAHSNTDFKNKIKKLKDKQIEINIQPPSSSRRVKDNRDQIL